MRKVLLTLGSITAVVAPTIAVVSCSQTTKEKINSLTRDLSRSIKAIQAQKNIVAGLRSAWRAAMPSYGHTTFTPTFSGTSFREHLASSGFTGSGAIARAHQAASGYKTSYVPGSSGTGNYAAITHSLSEAITKANKMINKFNKELAELKELVTKHTDKDGEISQSTLDAIKYSSYATESY